MSAAQSQVTAGEVAGGGRGRPAAVSISLAPELDGSARTLKRRGNLSRGRTWILIGADCIALAAAIALTYGIAEAIAPPALIAPLWLVVTLAVLALPAWIAIFTVYNLYERQGRSISLATFDELGDLFHALLAGSLIFLILSQVLRRVMGAEVFFPVEAAIFLVTALPLVLLLRGSVRSWIFPAVMQPRRTLIVGRRVTSARWSSARSARTPSTGSTSSASSTSARTRAPRRRSWAVPPTCRSSSTGSRSTGSCSPSRRPRTRTRSTCCAPPAGPTCTCRSCRASSRCSRPTRPSRSSRACRW